MKRILVVIAACLCCGSQIVFAQTGTDPGTRDSIWLDPVGWDGDTAFTTTLYANNDESLKQATIVFAWTSAQVGIDSVSLAGSRWEAAVTGGSGFFIADTGLVNGVLTPTRYNIAFLPYATLLPAGSGQVCRIYWRPPGPPATAGIIVVDTSTTSAGTSVRNSTLFGTSATPADNFVPVFVPDTIHVYGCVCDHSGDPTGDGVINVLDVVAIIRRTFSGASCTKDPRCPVERCNFNGDGEINVLDVVAAIDYTFRGGALPTNVCGL